MWSAKIPHTISDSRDRTSDADSARRRKYESWCRRSSAAIPSTGAADALPRPPTKSNSAVGPGFQSELARVRAGWRGFRTLLLVSQARRTRFVPQLSLVLVSPRPFFGAPVHL